MKRRVLLVLLALLLVTVPIAYAQFGGSGAFGEVVNYLKRCATSIVPASTATYDLGSSSKTWATIYAGTLSTGPLTCSTITQTVNSDTFKSYGDGTDWYLRNSDGDLFYQNDKSTNSPSLFHIKGKGTGAAYLDLDTAISSTSSEMGYVRWRNNVATIANIKVSTGSSSVAGAMELRTVNASGTINSALTLDENQLATFTQGSDTFALYGDGTDWWFKNSDGKMVFRNDKSGGTGTNVSVQDTGYTVLSMYSYATGAGTCPLLEMYRSNSGTFGTNTVTTDGQYLGSWLVSGYAGAPIAAATLGARIQVIQSGTVAGNYVPSSMELATSGTSSFNTNQVKLNPDKSVDFNGQYSSVLYNSGTTVAIDWNNGNVQYVTLSIGANTFTFSNPKSGGRYVLVLKQPTGGDGTATWPAAVLWSGATAPTLTTTDGYVDMITFVYDGVNSKYYGLFSLNFGA
jgi:hypothetical protein